jgi:16S rRNA (guanine(966)-N(2))-methyltransferase RsmD
MRVISGKFKGRKLIAEKTIKPTEDKVRKALFDTLRPIIHKSRFLDLYAGSGAVGIEALSEGAKQAYFVDSGSGNCKTIEQNLNNLKADAACFKILLMDCERAIAFFHKLEEKFDLIFVDPPYYQDLAKKALQTLGAYDILTRNGLIIIQHHRREKIAEEKGLSLWRARVYSATQLSFFCKETSPYFE